MPEVVGSPILTDDHPCAHCGYNLRGLQPSGLCPECAAPVERSVFGNQLQYADLKWLERIRYGVSLRLWSISIFVLVNVAGFISVFGRPHLGVRTVVGLIGGAVGLWASFAITTQEPRVSLNEDTVTWRNAIRVCAAAAFFGGLLARTGSIGGAGVLGVIGYTPWLLGLVAAFGEFLYLGRFAARVPDLKLARTTRIVLWGFTISTVLFVGAVICETRFAAPIGGKPTGVTPAGSPWSPSIAGVVTFFAMLSLAVFWLWRLLLIVRFKRAFTAALEKSRTLGLAPVPPPSAL